MHPRLETDVDNRCSALQGGAKRMLWCSQKRPETSSETHSTTVMTYTLNQAAKHAQKSKGTLSKAIANGRISAKKNADGSYEIDPSELGRWLSTVSTATPKTSSETHSTTSSESSVNTEIALLRERLADKDDVIDDLRQRLDQSDEERRRLTALLTDQRAQKAPEKPTEPWFKLGPLTLGGKR